MLKPSDLERSIAQIEERLDGLGHALAEGNAAALDTACRALLSEIQSLGSRLSTPTARPVLSDSQRSRWRRAQAQTDALREAMARAAAAQARALQALQIEPHTDGYGAKGTGLRTGTTGSLVA
jgi:hypothetical protein